MELEIQITRRALGAALLAVATATTAMGQVTVRASVNATGKGGNGRSESARISGNGRFVAFASAADNLVPGDGNGVGDVFVHDLLTGTTERVSVDSSGAEGNGDSSEPAISRDGRFVAFRSSADNLVAGDTNGVTDIFVHDRNSGATTRVSVDATGAQCNLLCAFPAISSDGSLVAFGSASDNLVPGDTNGAFDLFVKDVATGAIERVSVDSSGAQSNDWSGEVQMSGDGALVVFVSSATNLVAGDANGKDDIFVHDRNSGSTWRVNVAANGAEADAASFVPAISRDGSTVVFASDATNLVSGDGNAASDVFVVDLATRSIERASVASDGGEADGSSSHPRLSSDGRYVAFDSYADDLVAADANGSDDVFVHDRTTGVTWRASLDSSAVEGNDLSDGPDLDDGGRIVTFQSDATNLIPVDLNGFEDVFVRLEAPALWLNYGAGWPGTLGVPAFTASSDPVLGSTFGVDLANSLGSDTFALIFVGLSKQSLVTSADGTLLVDMLFTFPTPVPAAGLHHEDDVPDDESICGAVLFLQGLELDAGASHGISFSAGLEILVGR